ncbi:MAG: hypothetical protein O3B09_03570 [Proteobacteria bacterium]|nr:hypothetical protein [Pseudomonadota bacterium]
MSETEDKKTSKLQQTMGKFAKIVGLVSPTQLSVATEIVSSVMSKIFGNELVAKITGNPDKNPKKPKANKVDKSKQQERQH